jgi:hypothetical protein
MMLTNHIHQARKLQMSGAVPLLPPVRIHGVGKDKFIGFNL